MFQLKQLSVNCIRSELSFAQWGIRCINHPEWGGKGSARNADEKVTGRPWHPIKPTKTRGEDIMQVLLAMRQRIWQNKTC